MNNEDLEEVTYNPPIDSLEEDKYGHIWTLGWEETENPHPGFGGSQNIYGCYVSICSKCGMYNYEFSSCTATSGKYEGKHCGNKIREIK